MMTERASAWRPYKNDTTVMISRGDVSGNMRPEIVLMISDAPVVAQGRARQRATIHS